MNPKHILTKAILAAAGVALSSSAAMAVNPNFVAGDLVVFFQQRGGTNTIMLDVGQATLFRDATSNILNIANIGTRAERREKVQDLLRVVGLNAYFSTVIRTNLAVDKGNASASQGLCL